MATNATWTVIMDDKTIIQAGFDNGGGLTGKGYIIDDDAFWSQSKFSNIWAIQYGTSVSTDEVEHRDTTAHCTYADANLGDFQDFIDKWDAAHLTQLQFQWDNNNVVEGESESDKIARLGAKPTSYSS